MSPSSRMATAAHSGGRQRLGCLALPQEGAEELDPLVREALPQVEDGLGILRTGKGFHHEVGGARVVVAQHADGEGLSERALTVGDEAQQKVDEVLALVRTEAERSRGFCDDVPQHGQARSQRAGGEDLEQVPCRPNADGRLAQPQITSGSSTAAESEAVTAESRLK